MLRTVFVVLLAGAVVSTLAGPAAATSCAIDQPLMTEGTWGTAMPPDAMGQSFTACQTGYVTKIFVTVANVPASVTLTLQGGTDLGSPEYSQGATVVAGLNTIVLSTPYQVTGGATYSFGLFPIGGRLGLRSSQTNPYAGGKELYYDAGAPSTLQYASVDLAFRVEIESQVVPTLPTTWGSLKISYR
jgi:hypothetical protein